MKQVWEIVYIADVKAKTEEEIGRKEIRSKTYEDRVSFMNDFQIITNAGKPCMAQGPSKDGTITRVVRNGWNDDEVILTADVLIGTKIYSYSAKKHYTGKYTINTPHSGTKVILVKPVWRFAAEFKLDMLCKGYKEPVSFESVIVKKGE